MSSDAGRDLARLLVAVGGSYLTLRVLAAFWPEIEAAIRAAQSPPVLPPPTSKPLPLPMIQPLRLQMSQPTTPSVQPTTLAAKVDLEGVMAGWSKPIAEASGPTSPTPTVPALPADYSLAQVMPDSGVVISTGQRGGGKTGVNMRAQELLKDRLHPYAVGLPASAVRFLPEWYGLADDLSAVPAKASIYLPESHRQFHARNTQSLQGRAVGDLVNLVRHRQWLLFFDVQNLAHLDRNILSEADVLLIKEPGPFIQRFDRPQLREHIDAARAAFAAVGPTRKKRAVWVVAPAAGIHGKLMENALPTFWTDSLSRAFAGTRPLVAPGSLNGSGPGAGLVRRAKPASAAELRLRARQLRAAGHSYGEIANMLGVSKTQAYRLVNED